MPNSRSVEVIMSFLGLFLNTLPFALCAIIIFGICGFGSKYAFRPTPVSNLKCGFLMCGGLIFVALLTSPMYYEFPGVVNKLYVQEKSGTWKLSRFGAFEPKSTLAYAPATNDYRSTVQAVTPNPKVRKTTIRIEVGMTNPDTYFKNSGCLDVLGLNKFHKPGAKRCLSGIVKKLMYDFKDEKSIEISSFSNPLKLSQQKQFEIMAKKWFVPRLSKLGLTLTEATFNIPL